MHQLLEKNLTAEDVFGEEVLSLMAYARERMPGEYGKFKLRLRRLGIFLRGWFDSFIDADGKNRSQYQCKINGVNMRAFRCRLKVGANDSSEDDFLK